MALDLNKLSRSGESRVRDHLKEAHTELDYDLIGLWHVVAAGRETYQLKDGNLREFIVYAIVQIIAYGGHVIDGASDPALLWEKTDRYGTTPDEIALNIVTEWNAKGEPDVEAWRDIAFATQEWLDSIDNRRKEKPLRGWRAILQRVKTAFARGWFR